MPMICPPCYGELRRCYALGVADHRQFGLLYRHQLSPLVSHHGGQPYLKYDLCPSGRICMLPVARAKLLSSRRCPSLN